MLEYHNSKYSVKTNPDAMFDHFCMQITADYTSIMRTSILPDVLKQHNIGVREIRMLLLVDLRAQPMFPLEVAETLRYDPGTVSRASKRLLSAGLIKRLKVKGDKRAFHICLSTKGQDVADNCRLLVREHFNRLEAQTGETLTDEEKQTLLKLLVKLGERSHAMLNVKAEEAKALLAAK